MAAGLDNYKSLVQLVLGIGGEHLLEFSVKGSDCGRRHTKVDDARAEVLEEDKSPVIAITCDHDAALLRGDNQEFGVGCSR